MYNIKSKNILTIVICSFFMLVLIGCSNTPSQSNSRAYSEVATAETSEPQYNYIYFRYGNKWITKKLVSYKLSSNGLNIEFEVESDSSDIVRYYTSMANVVLLEKNIRESTFTGYALYPGNTLKAD